MLFLSLDCGSRVYLTGLDYSLTYSGLLEGRPDAEGNARIIDRALSGRESTWGKRTIHLITPTVDHTDPAHPKLPPVLLRAWLTCNEPIHPKFMASELVVLWFTHHCHSDPISDIVFQAIRGLPWKQLARDFDW